MTPLNPLFAISILFIALATAYLVNLKIKIPLIAGRYETIDGLRGFLAIGVFMHHAAVWHGYFNGLYWDAPKSNLYTHLGGTCVTFFFMITSFLFVTKLLNTGEKLFDWKQFFVSRFFRLVPLYYFSVIVLFLIVFFVAKWQLQVSAPDFWISTLNWATFNISATLPVNGSDLTHLINAGVIWSLRFEWLFYFCLPILGIFLLKKKPSAFYLIIAILFIVYYEYVRTISIRYMASFAGGAIAPFLIKYTNLNKIANHAFFSIVVLVCLACALQFRLPENYFCKVFITAAFTIIALGNSMFGILTNKTLKILGEICYSTYLLHGTILFVIFYFCFGFDQLKTFSPTQYCLLIFGITPIVVIASFLSYKYIEKPFIDFGKKKSK